MTIKPGVKVVLTADCGLCARDDETRFVGKADAGSEGSYIGKHPNRKLKGWHLVAIGDLVAPVGTSHFKLVED